jgi:glycosyltransferase involved in cell wall biosynthesis
MIKTDIIVPCRNEAGGIAFLLADIKSNLKAGDRIIVVEGNSVDLTWDICQDFANNNSEIVLLKQPKNGKFDAVMCGIEHSKAEQIMIWDADGTVSFEDNLNIYNFQYVEPFFITGDRLTGTRAPNAMQRANLIANYFFAIWWGILLKRMPIDSLCGSKKFPRQIFDTYRPNIQDKDPYGDFTIMWLSKVRNLSVFSIPVTYGARTYGKTNIQRWSGGLKLLKLVILISLGRL